MSGASPFKWLRGRPDSGRVGWTSQECWGPPLGDNPDVARFAPCHDKQLTEAQSQCSTNLGPYPNYEACVTTVRDLLIDQNCLQYCAGGGGTGTRQRYPWRKVSDETCAHQRELNAALIELRYQPVDFDCKLGPRTCGASNFVVQQGYTSVGIPDTCFEHQGEWINPVPMGQPPPPDCRRTPALCKATQSCDATTGECFEDCRKNASMCGSGTTCEESSGNCVPIPPPPPAPAPAPKKAGGPGGGVVVLGLAALLAFGLSLAGRG